VADRPQLTTTAGNCRRPGFGRRRPIIARTARMAGERGAADAERDMRGFALKFYTEGNRDLVGNGSQKS